MMNSAGGPGMSTLRPEPMSNLKPFMERLFLVRYFPAIREGTGASRGIRRRKGMGFLGAAEEGIAKFKR